MKSAFEILKSDMFQYIDSKFKTMRGEIFMEVDKKVNKEELHESLKYTLNRIEFDVSTSN